MSKEDRVLSIRDALMEMFTDLSEDLEVSSRDLLVDMGHVLKPAYHRHLSAALEEAGHWNANGETE